MAQISGPTGDQPTEQSPLLSNVPIISEAPPNSEALPISVNGGIAKKVGEDEESLQSGEIESGISRTQVARIISVLLIGIFVAHCDGSILLATHSNIASEFNDLGNSTWLITSFAIAGAATQTLYGKLSDIYGRKTLVTFAYTIFVVGCAIAGAGQTMGQVILGRVISGAGASGMASLVSILITDLLPIREVAQWRAYVNLVATFGRSLGGPLGGWLVDVIGWRWSFFGQVPIILGAIILVCIYLPNHTEATAADSASTSSAEAEIRKSKFSRIDFKGSFIFAFMILALLTPIELGGVRLPWTSPITIGLISFSFVLVGVFVAVEKRQEEPILPLEIFHQRDAVISYLILGLQTAAQLGLMFSVPLYFQITSRSTASSAGAHLVPAVVGNAIGGVLSGILIKRSGRYKGLIILAVTLSSLSYLLLMLRWHGNTNVWESLYIFPSGFGTGIAQSAVFISLQAVVDPAHAAPSISFMYLSSTVALTMGLSVSNAVMKAALRRTLFNRLAGLGFGGVEIAKIIAETVSDVDYVDRVTGPVQRAVTESYVDGLWWSHGVSFFFSGTAFVLALFIQQRRLEGTA
ncbi:major facilitator superfamily domain-containing protein [Apiosordaria backusii]|uniref:Major facilitator superfamily domain-containing protein n=1 Tax=Apiosordaria backusii TaxID=314023 RepID=A0AA40AIX2_9PEZI|nr:major facilitator superfamily domain-containing protein [Apiosordaria backusii]